jgi:muramoyltetrapeptide carboxypeptidase LdcA involved in peptidoglycan recycling
MNFGHWWVSVILLLEMEYDKVTIIKLYLNSFSPRQFFREHSQMILGDFHKKRLQNKKKTGKY